VGADEARRFANGAAGFHKLTLRNEPCPAIYLAKVTHVDRLTPPGCLGKRNLWRYRRLSVVW
ncbi:hypothetical protein, partial [Mesorhizobium sp. M7A.F.Ca.US.005.03.2.1]|uniref:hypothetical protein n=1 Tax=Mesorhizobium sp. M7A.F.Ca.US.005.03.2.1 TaxID=2496737 RepID=UPI0019D26FA9